MTKEQDERVRRFMQSLAYFGYNGSPINEFKRLNEVMSQFQNEAYTLYTEIYEQNER